MQHVSKADCEAIKMRRSEFWKKWYIAPRVSCALVTLAWMYLIKSHFRKPEKRKNIKPRGHLSSNLLLDFYIAIPQLYIFSHVAIIMLILGECLDSLKCWKMKPSSSSAFKTVRRRTSPQTMMLPPPCVTTVYVLVRTCSVVLMLKLLKMGLKASS